MVTATVIHPLPGARMTRVPRSGRDGRGAPIDVDVRRLVGMVGARDYREAKVRVRGVGGMLALLLVTLLGFANPLPNPVGGQEPVPSTAVVLASSTHAVMLADLSRQSRQVTATDRSQRVGVDRRGDGVLAGAVTGTLGYRPGNQVLEWRAGPRPASGGEGSWRRRAPPAGAGFACSRTLAARTLD